MMYASEYLWNTFKDFREAVQFGCLAILQTYLKTDGTVDLCLENPSAPVGLICHSVFFIHYPTSGRCV